MSNNQTQFKQIIVILDFGSQYSQLIARRIREHNTYCELLPYDISASELKKINPIGIIFSGGPNSVYDENSLNIDPDILNLQIPILGICYGVQLIVHNLGGVVARSAKQEYGRMNLLIKGNSDLFGAVPPKINCWMSHGDSIAQLPQSFDAIASTSNTAYAAIESKTKKIYGLQFHPEVVHTEYGKKIIENFVKIICQSRQEFTPGKFIENTMLNIKEEVDSNSKVVLALSGGVDSTTLAVLLNKCIPSQLICIFVDHGLLRKDEAIQLSKVFSDTLKLEVICVDAREIFLKKLQGITDPEEKRKIIGREFIEVFVNETKHIENVGYLAQGTLYPDVIESAGSHLLHKNLKGVAHKIKSHHNVGGLPENLPFKLLEPFNLLFKDEVRNIAKALGVPDSITNRQPFPGPGLAIRIIGEVNESRLLTLRNADFIVQDEIRSANLYNELWQSFAVLLPVKSTGVMGDQRTYADQIVIRGVTSDDGMTADWARIPFDILARISTRIVNEVPGINRVLYDITSKPPSTIEWE